GHRRAADRRLGGGQGDAPPWVAAGPLLGRALLAEGAREIKRPALVDDRHGPAPIADEVRIERRRGRRLGLPDQGRARWRLRRAGPGLLRCSLQHLEGGRVRESAEDERL